MLGLRPLNPSGSVETKGVFCMKSSNTPITGVLFLILPLWILVGLMSVAWADQKAADQAPGRTMAQQAVKTAGQWNTTDHAKHEVLKQTFTSGAQVTAACISCHSEAEAQFHKTIHWTWKAGPNERGVQMGK